MHFTLKPDLSMSNTDVSNNVIPSSAIKSDVFPEPVCPTMRLMDPCLKNTSSSMVRVKLRLLDPGVAVPSLSGDQVKDDDRIPIGSDSGIVSRAACVVGATTGSSALVVNLSRSSVCWCAYPSQKPVTQLLASKVPSLGSH